MQRKTRSRLVGVFGRIAGEMSKLRDQRRRLTATRGGRHSTVYRVDSSRINYELARALYNNEAPGYKLGGWAAAPIINTVVGFMGLPSIRCGDEAAQEVIDAFVEENTSLMQQTHRDALRDGDCWVWLTREETGNSDLYPESDEHRIVYNIIPPEQVADIVRDFTGTPIEYVLVSRHEWTDDSGQIRRGVVTQRITADSRRIGVEGDVPPGVEPGKFPNPWGFIPIVQFTNERDAAATNGRSDLEKVEPFIKAYHDVMMHAMQGSKLHSTPKLKLAIKNVGRFLFNNFGIEDPGEFAKRGGKISLEGHDLILLEEAEEAGFVEAKSATGSAEPLLKLLFRCIVDVSETPEFAFGAATASSHASVKEQMPVLIRRVERKRLSFEGSWKLLIRMVLAMTALSTGRKFATHAVAVHWDPVQERDEQAAAATLVGLVNALVQAVTHRLMSLESAVNYLAGYVDTMNEWEVEDGEGEWKRIVRTALFEDRLGSVGDEEEEALDVMVDRLTAGDG